MSGVQVLAPAPSSACAGPVRDSNEQRTGVVLGRMPNGNLVGYIAECSLPMSWTAEGKNCNGYHEGYDLTPGRVAPEVTAVKERYAEFLSRAGVAAKDLRLEVEFTTHLSGIGYLASSEPCVEIVTTDTHEYLEVEGRVCIE